MLRNLLLDLIRLLLPGNRNCRGLVVQFAASVFRAGVEVGDDVAQLLDRFVVRAFALFLRREFRFAQDTRFTVAAGPVHDRGGTGSEQVAPVERAVLFVEADRAVLDLVFTDVVFIEVEIK